MESKTTTIPLDQAAMDRAGTEAIRRAKTSDLIFILAHAGGRTEGEIEAIAAEIDRRIPVPDPRLGKLATIDTTSPENVQRAALLFAASLLLEVAEPKHDLAPNRTWEDAIAALERWATGAIGSHTR